MATWAQLKEVVSSNFQAVKDEGNVLTITFEFEGGSEHDVIVCRAGNEQIGDWAQVESGFGKVDDIDLNAVVRKSEEIVCGGVACNSGYVTLRHSVPMDELDASEILIPINAICASAHAFAQEFGQ
ncbi:MAG: hypothetical protein WCT04_26190 [Planctomycetota bacterium]